MRFRNLGYVSTLCFVLVLSSIVQGQSLTDQLDNCTSRGSTEPYYAIEGWPFHFNCQELFQEDDVIIPSTSLCYVSSSSISPTLTNHSFTANFSTTFAVALVFNQSNCWKKNVLVKVIPRFTGQPREASKNDVTHNRSVIQLKVDLGPAIRLECLPPSSSRILLPPHYQTTWWRDRYHKNGEKESFDDYTEFLREVRHRGTIISTPGQPDAIDITSVSYYNPAVYSCELRYNTQTAFVVHYSVCVKNKISNGPQSLVPTVLCSKEISFFNHDNNVIECKVHTSNKHILPEQMEVVWTRERDNATICRNTYSANHSFSETDTVSSFGCQVNGFENLQQKCFSYLPTDEELKYYPEKKAFHLLLNIRDAQESMDGNYSVKLRYLNYWSESQIVHFKFDPQRKLLKIVVILASILAFLLVDAALVFIVWLKWIPIVLCYRRHIGKCDKDGKEFVAILSYVYSNDLPESTRLMTKTIVHCIQEKMKEMNYRFYDSHRDFDQGSSVENLLKYLNESHRMIVILTDAYVEERWSRFEAQQGFLNMLKSRTKLIFIRTPGARKALNKLTRDGVDFSMELNEAMKASRNICWNEKMSESSLKDYVEYALPNLKRSDTTSYGEYHKLDNLSRSISRQTQISTLTYSESNDQGIDPAFQPSLI